MSVVDKTKAEEYMGRIVGYMTGGAACFGIWLGDELGFYRTSPNPRRGAPRRSRTRPAAIRGSSVNGWMDRSPLDLSHTTRHRIATR